MQKKYFNTWLTLADVSALGVPAPSVEADQRVLQTLVDVDAGEAGIGQGESVVALALEGPVHVNATAVSAHASLSTILQTLSGVCTVKLLLT